jgi:thiamine-phosphate pyrophosphorylase
MVLPRLYAILDRAYFSGLSELIAAAKELASAGVKLIQYRNKAGDARVMLEQARELRRIFPKNESQNPHFSQDRGEVGHPQLFHPNAAKSAPLGWTTHVKLIMNDRSDLCLAADFDGVHVGQDDLSPESVRKIIGPARWLGVSTHNPVQLREADLTSADYLAIGPVFATSSKEKPDPVVGLEGVRRARTLTRKPLVAIGGITRANAASVIEAGADSVAVISDLLREPGKSAEEFLRILR